MKDINTNMKKTTVISSAMCTWIMNGETLMSRRFYPRETPSALARTCTGWGTLWPPQFGSLGRRDERFRSQAVAVADVVKSVDDLPGADLEVHYPKLYQDRV